MAPLVSLMFCVFTGAGSADLLEQGAEIGDISIANPEGYISDTDAAKQ